MPSARSVSDIKGKLLYPALTSVYEVYIGTPGGDFQSYMSANSMNFSGQQDKIQLSCCEALLPGSQFATHEMNGDRTGVTERHVYRRNYDDRIDLTFYVDADPKSPYTTLRFFEIWMKYITNESVSGSNSVANRNFSYRVKYPYEYYGSLKITKFERDKGSASLEYNFVNIYPLNINSIPISYESSQLLKVTVSFSYIRYYITSITGSPAPTNTTPPLTPLGQAEFNNPPDYFTNPQFGVEGPQGTPMDRNEYYNNFGKSSQDATNSANFFNGRNVDQGVLGATGFA